MTTKFRPRRWLPALALATLPGCSSASAPSTSTPTPPSVPSAIFPHTTNVSDSCTAGDPRTPREFHLVERMQASRDNPLAGPPQYQWSVPTSAPVRSAPTIYSSYLVGSPTDVVMFAVDNYKPSAITAPGIAPATAATSIANWSSLTSAQQTEAEQSTVFLLTNIYAPTPTLLGWSNTATVSFAKDTFGLAFLVSSFDSTNLQVYALSQAGSVFCWDVPSPLSSAAFAPSQVGPMTTCTGWTTAGKGTSGSKQTYSVPFPVYDSTSDISEIYWTDDSGKLSCIQTGAAYADAGAGKAPSTCSSAYTSGAMSLSASEGLGAPTADPVSSPPGPPVESYVFVGGAYGTMYRVDDKQKPTVAVFTSTYCISTGAAGACPTTNTADYAIYGSPSIYTTGGNTYVYWVGHGTLYQAPEVGSGTGGAWLASDIQSLPLFTPTTGVPILARVSIDYQAFPNANTLFLATNNHLYKVGIPLSSGEAVLLTPLYRQALPQSLTIAPTSVISMPSGSGPLGVPFGWYDSVFVPSGYGSAPLGGSVGAPVSAGTLTATLSGGLEQYGCALSAGSPFLADVTSTSYGALADTDPLLDYESNGNLNFGYDTGGMAPAGGLAHYPASASPTSGWTCPAPSTLGSACGSTAACVGAPPPGYCVNDSDCAGASTGASSAAATLYCDTFPDAAFGTCVPCRTDSQCPQPTGASEVCDTNNAAYACVPTARCSTSGNCTNKTDDPDYNATLTSCNTTVGTTQFGLCGFCVSNTTCAPYASTPVCDQKNAASSEFGNCVECTADTDCTANDEYENAGLIHCDQNPGSPNFDHCAACANNSGQCGTGEVCDMRSPSAGTTYFDTCVACDLANAASCLRGQVCDTVLGDRTYDQCVTACTPAGSSNAPANGCGLSAPVCGAGGGCVECTTSAQCPGNASNSALVCNSGFVCECSAASDCPGGAAGGATCQNDECVP